MNRIYFFIILGLATSAYLATDIYLPSLPHISSYFNTSADYAQLTLSLYMLALCVSSLIFGPLSDGYGRKPMLYIGFVITLLGTAICIMASSIWILILGRIVQGLGMGALASVPRAIFPDLYKGEKLIKYSAYFTMSVPIVLAMAPILGGYIQNTVGWQGNFSFLLIYLSVMALLTWKLLPETNRFIDPKQAQFKTLIKNFSDLLRNKKYMGFVMCSTFAFAGISAYITSGPFLLQTQVGLSPVQFGWVAGALGLIITIISFINTRLVHRFNATQMVTIGSVFMFAGGVIGMTYAWFDVLTLSAIVIPTAIFIMGMGFTFSNAFAGAFMEVPNNLSGAAGALMGFIQIFCGAVASGVVALITDHNAVPMNAVFLITSTLSLIFIYTLLKCPNRQSAS